jgi:transcriptional regulator with XRE-family HTH domain
MKPTTLKQARERRGLTQAELADAAGVDQATVSRLEIGRVSNPSFDTVKKLARALRVAPEALTFDARHDGAVA